MPHTINSLMAARIQLLAWLGELDSLGTKVSGGIPSRPVRCAVLICSSGCLDNSKKCGWGSTNSLWPLITVTENLYTALIKTQWCHWHFWFTISQSTGVMGLNDGLLTSVYLFYFWRTSFVVCSTLCLDLGDRQTLSLNWFWYFIWC